MARFRRKKLKERSPLGRALALFGVVLGVYLAFFAIYRISRYLATVRLDTLEPAYYHYDFVEPRLRSLDAKLNRHWSEVRPPRVRVLREGIPLKTIAGIAEVQLAWNPRYWAWTGKWPCPWNAPDGEYTLELIQDPDLKIETIKSRPFRIRSRVPKPLPKRLAVLTWESVRELKTLKVPAPDGQLKDWRGLLDWAQFIGADAFWMLAGQTPGLKPGELWVSHNLPMIPEVARECKRRKLGFGVWAMNYLTMSHERVGGYEYALDVADGKIKTTRAISIRDAKRPKDMARLLKGLSAIDGVDYLGLDYIRNALGGYELADDFFSDMPGVSPPPGWERWSLLEKMTWFIHKKVARKDANFVDAWQWWRAHKVSLIIRQIKHELGDEKPLWAFTLTWERGWHHGQDVIMFRDAGVDADALMLYEATDPQFEWIIDDWKAYVKRGQVQLVVGDVVDWPLHGESPLGPEAFSYRMRRAIEGVYPDGLAAGIFVHDLERALNGRLGPYTTDDWLEEARGVVRFFKRHP